MVGRSFLHVEDLLRRGGPLMVWDVVCGLRNFRCVESFVARKVFCGVDGFLRSLVSQRISYGMKGRL